MSLTSRGTVVIATEEFKPWPEGGLLVGGAVRDALLGRVSRDLDWLVAEPRAAAEALAARLDAPLFPLDEVRGHWRVLVSAECGTVVHDFVPLRGTQPASSESVETQAEGTADTTFEANLEANLRARDFTMNALALRRSGELIDPTGGMADLEAGVVRMTSRESLEADPLRPLRAVRFAGQLGFELEPETETAIGERARAMGSGVAVAPAGERVRDELETIIAEPTGPATLALAARLELLSTFLPELAATRGVTQGPLHHLDVFEHSLEALGRLAVAFPDAGTALRLATLLHDIGKPATSGVHFTGRPTFYGHDRMGAALATTALRRLRFPAELIKTTGALIARHMTPLPRSDKGARRFVHRHRALLPDLLHLMIVDREAARGRHASEAGRRAYRLDIGRIVAVLEESPPAARLLTGDEVMDLLGLDPGPRVGEALALLDEAVAVGDVSERDGAVAYLRRYAAAQGW